MSLCGITYYGGAPWVTYLIAREHATEVMLLIEDP
jgi:hypothetical protein